MLEKLLVLPLIFNSPNLDSNLYLRDQNPAIPYANASEQSLVGSNCGTLQEIFDNVPIFSPDDLILRTSYKTNNNQTLIIDFYKKNGRLNNPSQSKPIEPIKWLDSKDFDAFVIYEVDYKGVPRKNSSASGYFKGPFMLALYDLFTRNGDELSIPLPDGYVENSSCYIIKENTISSIILDILETITEKRATQLKK